STHEGSGGEAKNAFHDRTFRSVRVCPFFRSGHVEAAIPEMHWNGSGFMNAATISGSFGGGNVQAARRLHRTSFAPPRAHGSEGTTHARKNPASRLCPHVRRDDRRQGAACRYRTVHRGGKGLHRLW